MCLPADSGSPRHPHPLSPSVRQRTAPDRQAVFLLFAQGIDGNERRRCLHKTRRGVFKRNFRRRRGRRLHLHAVVFSGKHAFRQSAFRNRIGVRMVAQQNGLTVFIRDKLGLIARAVRRRQRYALDPFAEGIPNRDRHRAHTPGCERRFRCPSPGSASARQR